MLLKNQLTQKGINMNEAEKNFKIKQLAAQINKLCSFFVVITDIKGNNTGKKKNI